MNTHERFTLVMARMMQTEISNSDPMRHSKRTAVNAAREALDTGIVQAERLMWLVTAIESDMRDNEKSGGQP